MASDSQQPAFAAPDVAEGSVRSADQADAQTGTETQAQSWPRPEGEGVLRMPVDALPNVAATADDPACVAAAAWAYSFEPVPGVDYKWAIEVARREYETADKDFDGVDAKALALAGQAGGGAGLVALASALAVSVGQIDGWVGLSTLPSVVMAGAALLMAVTSRSPRQTAAPPTGRQAVEWIEYERQLESREGLQAEAWTIGTLHLAAAMTRRATVRKNASLKHASTWLTTSIVCLMLPLLTSVCQKLLPDKAAMTHAELGPGPATIKIDVQPR